MKALIGAWASLAAMSYESPPKPRGSSNTRGRWVVAARHYDEVVGLRFTSLSRARSFARRVGGIVRRWRRHEWRPRSPWEDVKHYEAMFEATRDLIDEMLETSIP